MKLNYLLLLLLFDVFFSSFIILHKNNNNHKMKKIANDSIIYDYSVFCIHYLNTCRNELKRKGWMNE